MTSWVENTLQFAWNPHWLAGPIFDKELRIASRQKRSYLLRSIYVGLLTCFVGGVWLAVAPQGGPGSPVYQVSRMGAAGRYIVVALVWFQFIAGQMAALVLLGDAIRGEVRKRTLHLLAVTPLGGVQIAGGKLAGGLLPIVMLLGASLPLLALVRVFGGVPWDYLVSAVGVTFSALVFTGVLCVLGSVPRRSVLGVVGPALWFCLLARVPDVLIQWLAVTRPRVGAIGGPILLLVNPTDVLLARTKDLLAARPGSGLSTWWPLHCLIVLAASGLVLLLAARRIRPVAAEPVSEHTPRQAKGRSRAGTFRRRPAQDAGPIRRVKGSPVLWKELRTFAALRSRYSLLAKHGASVTLACLLVGAAIGAGVFGPGGNTGVIAVGMAFCTLGLHVGAAVWLSGVAATMIPMEREARTWPVLLATPLEAGQIVRDKAMAVLRRGLPVLGSLLAFLLFSSACVLVSAGSNIRPLLLVRIAGLYLGLYLVGLIGILAFLTGLGLYCGARARTVAGARGCTFAVVLLGALTLCVAVIVLLYAIVRGGGQIWVMMAPVVAVAASLACAGVGVVFLWAAARGLRRNAF